MSYQHHLKYTILMGCLVMGLTACQDKTVSPANQASQVSQTAVNPSPNQNKSELDRAFAQAMKAYKAENYDEAFKQMKVLAEQNYARAQVVMAAMYYYGRGVKKDLGQAKKWAHLAAEQNPNNASIQKMLGVFYWEEKNIAEAEKWFEKAAQNGNYEGYTVMGVAYYKGEEVDINFEKSIFWFKKAEKLMREQNKGQKIQKELSDVQFILGGIYHKLNDKEQAKFWFDVAAQNGSKQAKEALQEISSK